MSAITRHGSMNARAVPALVDVPSTEKQIKETLRNTGTKGNYHLGLLAALKSVKNRRSAKNAYILLLGQTGAGKSSSINFLFENHQITKTGHDGSETSDILEFAASVPIPELGVKNSEIRVIDTPGLGDTRGLENDAKFIATLSKYLNDHEDLSKAVPNVVLIVGKFDDNRLDGPSSGFTRMLKGVKLLEDQLIDKKFSNIIIVLTHYMNGKKELRNNPLPRYELVARLVKDTGFPEPISVIGAENEAEDLPEMNGYFKLPSGEYYPYNIFRRIQQITTENDPIGEAVIRTAFTNPAMLNVYKRKEMGLLGSSENPMYARAVDELIGSQFSVQPTPISNKLASVWENSIHPELRKNYSGSLKIVQNIFQVRQIREFNQLPRNPDDIIKFLKEIPQNEAILNLLEKALGIVVPELNIAYMVGQGYDVLKDHSAQSPFQFTTFKSSPLGYKLPVGIKCELVNETEDICVFNESRQDYTSRRLTDLNLPSTEVSLLSSNVKAGYNVMQQMKANNNNEFTTVREHRLFQLTLEDPPLAPSFIKEIETLPKFSDQAHIKQIWKAFFDRYGTHVVNSAFGGGSIETYIQENHVKTLMDNTGGDFSKAMARLTELDRDITISQLQNNNKGDNGGGENMKAFGVKFRGGNMKYHKSDLNTLDPDDVAATLENWRTSLAAEPIMLDTKLKLMPLSYHVRKKNASIANEIEVACRALFDNSFNFVPTQKEKPPPKRLDVRSLADFDRSSCLRAGTRILMGDGSTKAVELLKAGDVVLDAGLKPTTVLGCNSFFLGSRSFYGFAPGSAFFTEVHLFLGPDGKLNVVSKDAFVEENPVFELLEDKIVRMRPETDLQIMRYDSTSQTVRPFTCQLHEEKTSSDGEFQSPDTPVYFLEVDSPTGTYFANNFVCRHELPPFELWPNTFNCLREVLFAPQCPESKADAAAAVLQLAQIRLTRETYHALSLLAKDIASTIDEGFSNGDFVTGKPQSECPLSTITKEELQEGLKQILEHQTLVAFGLLIYSKCSKILASHLDKRPEGINVNTQLIRNVVHEKVHQFLEFWCLED